MSNSLEAMVKNAEKLQAEIVRIITPLGSRDLLQILQYLTENFWTEPREEEENETVQRL